jgi:hypothetical protein
LNAYDLADRIKTSPYAEYKSAKEAANMLRGQADKLKKYELRNQEQIKRIAELEKENAFLKDWRDTWSPYVNTTKQSEKK